LIKIIILEENFKWHLEAFASELFIFLLFVTAACCIVLSLMHFVLFAIVVIKKIYIFFIFYSAELYRAKIDPPTCPACILFAEVL